jgi:glycosyltransferase involved in cell wall biosynthesis
MYMEDLPYVSICMPIYNRNEWKPLILSNLLQFNYPKSKLEFCIDDDGTDPFFKNNTDKEAFQKLIHPIKLNYYYREHKRNIGTKRNNLVKIATHKIIASMDSDDLYLPVYIIYGITEMKKQKVSCVGSNQMLFLYPHHNFEATAIRCQAKRQIHEATCIFTKKHHRSMGGFVSSSQGEGAKMADFNEKNVGLLDIQNCMVCICHNDNTINKDMFFKEDKKILMEISDNDKDIIRSILNVTHQ